MKKWNVIYSVTVEYEAGVYAHTKKEAVERVKEVIGDDAKIVNTWELKDEN